MKDKLNLTNNLEILNLIEILSTALGKDAKLKVKPGQSWHYEYEKNTLEFPQGLIFKYSLDEIAGFILHEIGHRHITRVNPNHKVFKHLFEKDYRKLLFYVFEDIRCNEWVTSHFLGARPYLERVYNKLISKDLSQTDYVNYLQKKLSQDIHPYLFYPHLEFIFCILYFWQFQKLPPFILNPEVKEILENNLNLFKALFNSYPKESDGEREKFTLTLEMAKRIVNEILPAYEKLVDASQQKLKTSKNTKNEENIQFLIEQNAGRLLQEFSPKIEDHFDEDQTQRASPQGQEPLSPYDTLKKMGLKGLINLPKISREIEPISLYHRLYAQISPFIQHFEGVLENYLYQNTKPIYTGHFGSGQRPDLRKAMRYTRKIEQNIPLEPSDTKIFLRRRLPTEREHYIALVLDESGSMAEPKRTAALKGLLLFMETLSHLKIKYAFIGFADTVVVHKKFEELNQAQRERVFNEIAAYIPHGLTADADAISYTTHLLKRESKQGLKLIIVITDGEGNVNHTGKGLMELQQEAQRAGIEVIGIGIGGFITDVKKYYQNAIQIRSLKELPLALGHILEKRIMESYLENPL